jgi:two-component system, OmpR family, response regulator VicR
MTDTEKTLSENIAEKENAPPHILFVEDDVNLSFVTRDNLEKQGYKITTSHDGIEAWKLFQENEFDLCILDVMLPGNDGFSLAKQIREVNRQVPILFLTSKSMKEDRIEGLKQGGDDYITKPFSIEELILRIEVFLKRRMITANNPSPEIYRLGESRFDFANLVLYNNGNQQQLTQKEGDLLKLFCNNRNKLLKREDILKTIWGDDDYFLGRSLDVFISRLRKYLRHETGVSIVNVHGIGFRMEG